MWLHKSDRIRFTMRCGHPDQTKPSAFSGSQCPSGSSVVSGSLASIHLEARSEPGWEKTRVIECGRAVPLTCRTRRRSPWWWPAGVSWPRRRAPIHGFIDVPASGQSAAVIDAPLQSANERACSSSQRASMPMGGCTVDMGQRNAMIHHLRPRPSIFLATLASWR